MKGAETISLPAARLEQAARELMASGGRMQMVYACLAENGEPELRYLAAPPRPGPFQIWNCRPGADPPSLAPIWPLLGWYEREIMDLFDLSFRNNPEPEPLVLPPNIPPPFMRPGQGRSSTATPATVEAPRSLPAIAPGDVQVLPFGPVRAGVFESAEFTFFYLGERIIHYQPHLFFKHRGMEQRFEGADPQRGVILAERVSGVGTVAHALAFCQAVEAAADCTVPERARWLRTLLAELERVYNHLHYHGHLSATTTLKVGDTQGKLLEERVKQINARLTGSRFLRSLLIPGGLRRDLAPVGWLATELEALSVETARYTDMLEHSASHLDRLITTGPLSAQVAFDQGATGPILRASGADRDLRRDHPYAAYGDLPVRVQVRQEGDACARYALRAAEIDTSLALLQRILQRLPGGPVRVPCLPQPGGEGLGWSESPRGSLFYAVHFGADGRLSRVKIKSPSFSNWRIFPSTVHETNMMDYAINEASFGLTVSGCAR